MSTLRQTPDDYLFNLEVTNSGDAKRLWRERIKENWDHECAYCGSDENITLDHVRPRSLGGEAWLARNVVCACHDCNQSKGHAAWREWYEDQEFYEWNRLQSIINWIAEPKPEGRYNAYRRRNVCYAA